MVLKLEREDFRREDLSNSEEKEKEKNLSYFFLNPFLELSGLVWKSRKMYHHVTKMSNRSSLTRRVETLV